MTAAIVLAAGLSRRMGWFKLTLPWGDRAVISQVIATLETAGIDKIVVVAGHRADEITQALAGMTVRIIFNPDYASGEMLSSIQAGLRALDAEVDAALLCLGDQPQMMIDTIRAVVAAGAQSGWGQIVIPSYRMRAGHPILLPYYLWPEILDCTGTLRDVMAAHRDRTHFLVVDTSTILADLDTPEDYAAGRPTGGRADVEAEDHS
jgi:molybdenum cofactor cytidylyltransferase